MSLKAWLEGIRIKFFIAGIPPVILGFALAYYYTKVFDIYLFLLAMIVVSAAMAGCYTFNEYFDYMSGVDVIIPPENVTPFNAGSRVLPSGLISPSKLFRIGVTAWFITIVAGGYLTFLVDPLVGVFVAIGVIAGAGYTMPPLKWAYRGVGEFFIGISYGPLIVLGSYYLIARSITIESIIASLPVGFLITAVILINEFPDYPADKEAGKRNLIVRLGRERGVVLYSLTVIFAYVTVILGVLLNTMPLETLLTLITLPIAIKSIKIAKSNYGKPKELIPAMKNTILIFTLVTFLEAMGYVIAFIAF